MLWRCYKDVTTPDKPAGDHVAATMACLRLRDGAANMPAMSLYALAEPERDALVKRDVRTLYAMGVHGLLLRPFTLLHQMPEPDYLKAIRGE
jgi:hypothetical protein